MRPAVMLASYQRYLSKDNHRRSFSKASIDFYREKRLFCAMHSAVKESFIL